MIHNYGNPYEKWNTFVARPHLWLQLGMVKPEIMLCETVLNLSTLNTLTYPDSWWRGSVVERRSLAGELSLSCARPAADG